MLKGFIHVGETFFFGINFPSFNKLNVEFFKCHPKLDSGSHGLNRTRDSESSSE